jgi:hypothetical protein
LPSYTTYQPVTTLYDRRAGRPIRRDSLVNSKKLTKSEEEAIFQYILELDARSFPPRLSGVEDIANHLLRVRDALPVGKLEFLYAFCAAFFAFITKRNIQGGFAGSGLMPHDLKRVLSKLDVKLRTPIPLRATTLQPWVF